MAAVERTEFGMNDTHPPSLSKRLKNLIIGRDLDLGDKSVFQRISLIAFFAWVGLGADGLSSSCYGPAEAYLALGKHPYLAIFVALATGLTIFVISAGYAQIIELFPTGGGGYIVASKLLSPTLGMVSGCALLIDYALTITLSIASGADAIFSFLPAPWHEHRLLLAVAGVLALTLLNLRGVKESVLVLAPIFLAFVLTHLVVLGYGVGSHASAAPEVAANLLKDTRAAHAEMGFWGLLLVVLHAYSMGAGTYTGIEAVSNGLPILREPKALTGKKTMRYMALSLSVTVVGLILAYLLFNVTSQPGKTLNATLFEAVTMAWPQPFGQGFVLVTLISEAMLLFVAAQAGFVDGPRVLSNMAIDRWFPTKFALLSDRLVTQNGVLLMGGASLLLMVLTRGAVELLLVLYSINVFVTFVLSQLGMVRHWWSDRKTSPRWRKGLLVNGTGLILTSFILCSVVFVKFFEGGWVTLLVTGALVWLAVAIRRHYQYVGALLQRLNLSMRDTEDQLRLEIEPCEQGTALDPNAPTAVILVNGYNGLGLRTLHNLARYYRNVFRNFVFLQVGVVDAAVFRSPSELDALKERMAADMERYAAMLQAKGLYAEPHCVVGTDINHEVLALAPELLSRFPNAVFFGGQIVFKQDTLFTRFLHNHVVFALQRSLYRIGAPFMVMPLLVEEE